MFQSILKVLKRRKIFFALLLIVVGVMAQRLISEGQGKPQYQTVKVQRGTIASTVSASGQILVNNLMEVKTQASGQISKVYVEDGDKVSKGQKVAELKLDQQSQQKNASAWASYLSAKNTVDSANATAYTLRSTKDTAWKKFYDLAIGVAYQNADGTPRESERNSSVEFQTAQADWLASEAKYKNQQGVVEQAQAALNSAWLSYQLASPIITVPMDGVVGDLTIAPGMVLGQAETAQKIAVIRSEGVPIASFNLSEIDVTKVKKGQKATITLDSLPDKEFGGKVIGVDRTGVVLQGVTNYPATVQFDTRVLEILPNMAASASIVIDAKKDILILPSSALQTRAGQNFVRIEKDGRLQQVRVEVGLTSDTQVEIISGLSEADVVIIGTVITQTQQRGASPFGGFGGGTFRPGGFGGGSQMQQQH